MCECYELKATVRELVRHFKPLDLGQREISRPAEMHPTDPVLMVTRNSTGYLASRARWGLVGSFLDLAPRNPLINLHSENLEAKPFYGKLLKRQRCLIPATAFFEWQAVSGGKRKVRISDSRRKPLLLAGIYDQHRLAGTTCAILTMAANDSVAPIHQRMPVILTQEEGAFWLAEHDEFPSDAYAEMVLPSSRGALVTEVLAEPEVSPQLAFAFA